MKEYQKFDFYQEEEDYLSEMSAKGYQIKSIDNSYYEFEQKEGRYFYRLYYISDLTEQELDDFVEEKSQEGIEIVMVDGMWAYFRSKEPFHLYHSFQQRKIDEILAKRYRKMGYGFFLASVGFMVASLVAGSLLYVGVVIFFVLGMDGINKSNRYRNRGDE